MGRAVVVGRLRSCSLVVEKMVLGVQCQQFETRARNETQCNMYTHLFGSTCVDGCLQRVVLLLYHSIPFEFDTPSSSNNPRSSFSPKSKSSSGHSNALYALFLFLFVPVDNGLLAFLLALDDESFALCVPFDEQEERGA